MHLRGITPAECTTLALKVTDPLFPRKDAASDIALLCAGKQIRPSTGLIPALDRITDRLVVASGRTASTLNGYLRAFVALRAAANAAGLAVTASNAPRIATLLGCRYGLTGGSLRNYMTAARMMAEDLAGDPWPPLIQRKVGKVIAAFEEAHGSMELRTTRQPVLPPRLVH